MAVEPISNDLVQETKRRQEKKRGTNRRYSTLLNY